jgi:hypothetical protein
LLRPVLNGWLMSLLRKCAGFCLSAAKARAAVGVQPVLRNTCINRAADPRAVPPFCDVLFMVNYAETLPSYWCGRKRRRGAMRSFPSCK